ncbi:hypothetical protein [Flaviaesturariibacter terrae]
MTFRPILFVCSFLLVVSCSEERQRSSAGTVPTAVSTVDPAILNADSDIVEAQRQPVVGNAAAAAHQSR